MGLRVWRVGVGVEDGVSLQRFELGQAGWDFGFWLGCGMVQGPLTNHS